MSSLLFMTLLLLAQPHLKAARSSSLQAAPAAPTPGRQQAPAGHEGPPSGQPGQGAPQQGQSAQPAQQPAQQPASQPGAPRRFGRFDLDQPLAQLGRLPELRACAAAFAAPSGHADCTLPPDAPDRLGLGRVQVAWEAGGTIIALRLLFDPTLSPALTDLEWQLTRGWGPPVLEQLRREKDTKTFTLQWEDPEHRATLEASGNIAQPSRAVAVVLERRQLPLTGDLAGLHPRPFANMRLRWIRRIDWEGQPHALVWGSSLTPAQEAMGEAGASWGSQRGYVGLWRLEPATAQRPRRWRELWERTTGDEDDGLQRVLFVDARDITGDGTPDIEVELSCETCGATASELILKTVRAGKLVDLLAKRDLFRAQVEMQPLQIRIAEPQGDADEGSTVSTYAYDRGKGAFVLSREEHVGGKPLDDR